MTLGAPSLGEQFYFADGEVAPNVIERYSIYNGSENEAVVNVVFLGLDPNAGFINPEPLTVPAGKVVSLIADDVGVPGGSSRGSVLHRDLPGRSSSSGRSPARPATPWRPPSCMGSPSAFASNRWSMAIGTDLAVPDVLVVLNADGIRGNRHGEDPRCRRRGPGPRHGGDRSTRRGSDHDRRLGSDRARTSAGGRIDAANLRRAAACHAALTCAGGQARSLCRADDGGSVRHRRGGAHLSP